MASIAFPSLAKKTRLSDGTTYGYVYVPAKDHKPTVLLLHGFPSSSYDWRHQIESLPKKGYGIIAPDLLGYGDTDKPEAYEAYRLNNITAQVTELLSKENLHRVIGVAHDWGSGVLSALAVHYKSLFTALAFVAVGFADPSLGFNLDAINTSSQELLGYSTSGYMELFNASYGTGLIESTHQAFDSLLYTADPENDWKRFWGPLGAAEEFLRQNKTVPIASYISPEELDIHDRILLGGGYTGPTNWYKAILRLGASEADKALTAKEKEWHVPTLLILTERDPSIIPDEQLQATEKVAKNLTVARRGTGHWTMLEDSDGFEELLEGWLQGL